jgi:hypothetical protein
MSIVPASKWRVNDHQAAAWADRAPDLARWALDRYFIRRDVWGGYVRVADRGKVRQRPDGSHYTLGTTCTRPAKASRGKVFLTEAVLARHFRPRGAEDVVGAHTTSLDNLSHFGTIEVDNHGPGSTPAAVNEAAALLWYEELRRRGFHPLLWDSNGAGGYHLDLLLAAPVETPRLYWFLRRLVADHQQRGLPATPECFPKQPRLDPRPDGRGCCGNWVRLVGRHHSRDCWAKVWSGERWLAGEEAVEFILGLAGDPAALVPPEPARPPQAPTPLAAVPPAPRGVRGWSLSDRIAAYCRKLPHLAEGQGRDDVAFNFAAWLVNDVSVSDGVALAWLERWDAGNSPPKGTQRLQEILANAHRYGRGSAGSGPSRERPRVEVRPTGRPGHGVIACRSEVI